MTEINAYNEALQSGQYQRPSGLLGKYDNVRRLWEDEQLGLYLRPRLERLVSQRKACNERLRILDLGCGGGDGFDFITGITSGEFLISEHNTKVIEPSMVELYQGIDNNEGLLKQAEANYGNNQNVSFVCSDFNDVDLGTEEPYDICLANYGTLSHNTDEQTIELLSNLAAHCRDGAIIIIDWLGRYSYEWQTLWTKELEDNQWMDYAISYIYPGDDVKQEEVIYFPLRIIGSSEVQQLYRQVRKRTGGRIVLQRLADRSSFVGRHVDTAQYNSHCQPLRRAVNKLFEPNLYTSLDELIVNYVPKEGFPEINSYYQKLAEWWDYLIIFTKALLEQRNPLEAPPGTPATVRRALSTMKQVVRASLATKIGKPRANLVEPQLGYCLRELETGLQKGMGCGHGLVAIFEIVR
jgi:SAM-dependent methyltransferase